MRFARRGELEPGQFGFCQVEELPASFAAPLDADDILLLVKRRMADTNPTKVVTVMTAERSLELRAAFVQPAGVAERRPIGAQMVKNIQSYAPRCARQGSISMQAAAYLTEWVAGRWPVRPRPRAYSALSYRQTAAQPPRGPAQWLPGTSLVLDLSDHVQSDDEDEDEGPVQA